MEIGSSYLLQKLNTSVWYVRPEILQTLSSVLSAKFNDGLKLTNLVGSEKETRPKSNTLVEGKMVIPVYGVLLNRAGGMDALCGAYGYNMLKSSLQEAYSDDSINHVILEWDSPGGMACGCEEMANEVRILAGVKRVTSLCVGQMCSAAYYIGSAADEIFASDPMCMLGSIGCCITHCDESAKNEKEGLKFTTIYAGKHKIDGNSDEPLKDEVKKNLQEMVDLGYDGFLSSVAKSRGLSVDSLRPMAEGIVYMAGKTPTELFDGFKTLDELLTEE